MRESEVYNATRGIKERVARLFLTHANKREKIKSATVGSIALVVGLKDTKTGDTITNFGAPLILESVETYLPVISIAVEPQTRSDQEKLTFCLEKIAQEDPSFVYSENQETGQLLISGMGELHLEIIVDRLRREYNVEVQTGNLRSFIKNPFQVKPRPGLFLTERFMMSGISGMLLLVYNLEQEVQVLFSKPLKI